jgi:hypothetical protein
LDKLLHGSYELKVKDVPGRLYGNSNQLAIQICFNDLPQRITEWVLTGMDDSTRISSEWFNMGQ